MAELTTLEEKLAEVLGLAQAAQGATEKIEGLVEDEGVASTLRQMREEADGLDGFEFLTMAEAGEVGHWAVLEKLNESAGEQELRELVEWALPIQERHLTEARQCSLELAGKKDPYEES